MHNKKHEAELAAYIDGVLTAAISKAVNDVKLHLIAQRDHAMGPNNCEEYTRINLAEPDRWLAMARSDFQSALMKLSRAVAQPTTF